MNFPGKTVLTADPPVCLPLGGKALVLGTGGCGPGTEPVLEVPERRPAGFLWDGWEEFSLFFLINRELTCL